jgi:hypothetical protein
MTAGSDKKPHWYVICQAAQPDCSSDTIRLTPGRDVDNRRLTGDWIAAMTASNTENDATSSEGIVTVTETGTGTYTQQTTAGRHQLFADEPRPIGEDADRRPTTCCLRPSVHARR